MTTELIAISDSDVADVIESIGLATNKFTTNTAILGCLATALTLAYGSTMTRDKLALGIKDLSERMLIHTTEAKLTVN